MQFVANHIFCVSNNTWSFAGIVKNTSHDSHDCQMFCSREHLKCNKNSESSSCCSGDEYQLNNNIVKSSSSN